MTSKLTQSMIGICFIAQRIKITDFILHIFAYLFDFYFLDRIYFVFIMFLVRTWGGVFVINYGPVHND